MEFIRSICRYLLWHYTQAVTSLVSIGFLLTSFVWNYFSVQHSARHFFEPWGRAMASVSRGNDVTELVSFAITSAVFRTAGILVRAVLIVVGVLCTIATALLIPCALFAWLLLPLGMCACMSLGILLFVYAITR